jgi:hypothetical protein
MSVTLWLDTSSEETIELGGVIPVYHSFAQMRNLAAHEWYESYPSLAEVLHQCELQEDAEQGWLKNVVRDATAYLDKYITKMPIIGKEILLQLKTEIEIFLRKRGVQV